HIFSGESTGMTFHHPSTEPFDSVQDRLRMYGYYYSVIVYWREVLEDISSATHKLLKRGVWTEVYKIIAARSCSY
ncbi:MAG: hypothetical protein ACRENZ_10480, partial [Thermodesulfobacteriota bacterium]